MSLLLTCSCGKHLRVADTNAGKKVRCPGCGAVLTAPAEELLEVLPVAKASSAPESPLPEVLPVVRPAPVAAGLPPPLPAVQPAPPEPPHPPDCEVIELKPMSRKHGHERWLLELAEEEVRLLDNSDRIAMRFGREEANLRFMFPSFWLSIKSLRVTDGAKATHDFCPDKPVLRRIQRYLDRVLRQDAEARRKYKQRGLYMLVSGGGIALFGAAAVTFLVVSGWYGTRSYRGIGLTLASVVLGLVLAGFGLRMYLKARHMDNE